MGVMYVFVQFLNFLFLIVYDISVVIKLVDESSLQVYLEWKGRRSSEAEIRELKFTINSVNEDGSYVGPSPTETLLAALGGCMISNMAKNSDILRIRPKEIQVFLEGKKSIDETPRIEKISVTINVKGDGISQQKLNKLRDMVEKYCTVGNTLKNPPEIYLETHLINET